ncbi:hypothetical protein JCM10908_005258 [Rhodotorula pacifica]|uniref:uncharacterized protein n=1 Tax=Rhodotorula pacifica TaxID=1495444 RepID=UPI00317539B1
MDPPAPSPAPTLDTHFPGFYPPTPSVATQDSQPQLPATAASSASAIHEPAATAPSSETADTSPAHEEAEANKHRLEGAGIALLGAAAGFVVGGPIGAALGGGLAGMSAVEHQGITESAILADEPKHPAKTEEKVSPEHQQQEEEEKTPKLAVAPLLDTHEAFGTPAVEKEQAELAHSPAQQLLAGAAAGGDEKATEQNSHLGETLLAGAAGAKLVSNEVEEPTTDRNAEDVSSSESQASPVAPSPDFGTPAIEKTQSSLVHSPAQRLLAESVSSTSASTPPLSAEAALLGAAAAGATSVGKVENEVEEPATVPVDEAVERDLQAGGGVPTSAGAGKDGGEKLTAAPLGDENEEPTTTTDALGGRPSLPTPSGSLESFSGAVLAASRGVETPSVAPGPAASGFGLREEGATILVSDRDIEGEGAKETLHEDTLAPTSVPLPVDTPGARSDVSLAGSDGTEVPRESNPFQLGETAPLVGGAALGAAGAGVVGSELVGQDAPKDFEPYTPPAVSEPVETPYAAERGEESPALTAQDKGKGRAVDEALAVAAAGGGGFAMAVGLKSFTNESSVEKPAQTSTFTENFDTPPVSAATATDPLWNQRAELPPIAQSLEREPSRVLDPKELAATAVPATSPEQAGFVGVAAGAQPTPAMQDFAHLPQPAPNAQEAALESAPPATTESQEKRSNAVPLAAAGLAGAGAGAAGATLLAREPTSASTPTRAAPVSRFKENTTDSPLSAGAGTPSSTRAVMGSPAPVVPQQQQQQQPVSPTTTSLAAPHAAAPASTYIPGQPHEAATIERSPHMKITTAVVDGHKRLHRKSLSKGSPQSGRSSMDTERPASNVGSRSPAGFAPMQQQQQQQPIQAHPQSQPPIQQTAQPQTRFAAQSPQQQQAVPSNAAVSGPTGAAGARPVVPARDAEARRDRMMDNLAGVRDPLVSGPIVGATAPVRAPSTGTTSPTASSPSSPLAPTGPGRMDSNTSSIGQRHNETHAGAPPTALGVTAVTAAVIPGMATLPPVGGMPNRPHEQQRSVERNGPGVAPPSAVGQPEPTGNVQRKLSKRHPHEPVEKERKEGFFSKIFGGGSSSSHHSRNASQNSRNSANGSPRASAEIPRQ